MGNDHVCILCGVGEGGDEDVFHIVLEKAECFSDFEDIKIQ